MPLQTLDINTKFHTITPNSTFFPLAIFVPPPFSLGLSVTATSSKPPSLHSISPPRSLSLSVRLVTASNSSLPPPLSLSLSLSDRSGPSLKALNSQPSSVRASQPLSLPRWVAVLLASLTLLPASTFSASLTPSPASLSACQRRHPKYKSHESLLKSSSIQGICSHLPIDLLYCYIFSNLVL
jgi:hypothetical protein